MSVFTLEKLRVLRLDFSVVLGCCCWPGRLLESYQSSFHTGRSKKLHSNVSNGSSSNRADGLTARCN